jgi:hypothetical protein
MRTYIQITGVVFAIVALAHVARLVLDWPAQVAGWVVPMWISWVGILVAGALCVWAFRLVGRVGHSG